MRVDYSVLRPTADGSITSVANCTWQVCVKPPLRSTPSTGVASAARQDAKPKGVTSVVPACKAYWSGARRNTALSPTVDQTVELGPATALRGTAADPKRYWTWTSNNVWHHRVADELIAPFENALSATPRACHCYPAYCLHSNYATQGVGIGAHLLPQIPFARRDPKVRAIRSDSTHGCIPERYRRTEFLIALIEKSSSFNPFVWPFANR